MSAYDYKVAFDSRTGKWGVYHYTGGLNARWSRGRDADTRAEAEAAMAESIAWEREQVDVEIEAYLCGFYMGRVSERIARMKVQFYGVDFDEEYAKRLPDYPVLSAKGVYDCDFCGMPFSPSDEPDRKRLPDSYGRRKKYCPACRADDYRVVRRMAARQRYDKAKALNAERGVQS